MEAERHEATCYARPSCDVLPSSSDVAAAVTKETNEIVNVDATVNNIKEEEEFDVCIVPNPNLNLNEISGKPRKSKRSDHGKRKPFKKPNSSTIRKSKQSTLSNHLAGKCKRELRSSVKSTSSKGIASKKEVHSFFKMHANPKEKEKIKEKKDLDRDELASLSAKELKAAKFAAELTERRNMERKRNSEKRKHFSNGDDAFGLFHSKKVHDNNWNSKQRRKDKENNDCSGKDVNNNEKSSNYKAKAKQPFTFIKPQTQNSKTKKATNEVKEEKRIFFPVPSYIQISDDYEPMNIRIPVESRFASSLHESSSSSSLEPMKLLCSNDGITNDVSHTDLLHTPDDDDVYSLIYNYLEQMNEHGWEEDIKLMRSAWSKSCGGDVTCPRRILEFGVFLFFKDMSRNVLILIFAYDRRAQ